MRPLDSQFWASASDWPQRIYWFKSAQIKVDPGWKTQLDEPVELTDQNSDWITGVLEWSDKAAALNAKAAILTACAVVFSTIASVLGSLAAFR